MYLKVHLELIVCYDVFTVNVSNTYSRIMIIWPLVIQHSISSRDRIRPDFLRTVPVSQILQISVSVSQQIQFEMPNVPDFSK
jgi:hypothetical protein